MKISLHLLFLFFFSLPVDAIEIAVKNRIPNQEPGYCGWASLETLGRHHQIESLYDLLEKRKSGPEIIRIIREPDGKEIRTLEDKHSISDWSIKAKLEELKLAYELQETGSFSRDILKYTNDQGCLIGVSAGARGPDPHIVILINYDEEKIRFWDCNYPNNYWRVDKKWLDYWWTGLALVIKKQ